MTEKSLSPKISVQLFDYPHMQDNFLPWIPGFFLFSLGSPFWNSKPASCPGCHVWFSIGSLTPAFCQTVSHRLVLQVLRFASWAVSGHIFILEFTSHETVLSCLMLNFILQAFDLKQIVWRTTNDRLNFLLCTSDSLPWPRCPLPYLKEWSLPCT